MELFISQLKSMVKDKKDFSQQLKQRLVHESAKVKNPFNFVATLLKEGVLSDESSEQDSNFGLTVVFIVQLVMMMACSKGADAIGGLMKALEASGNSELITALRAWVKDDFPVAAERLSKNSQRMETSLAHFGTVLIDNMISHVKEELMGQLAGRAANIAHVPEDVPNLAHQDNFLEEPNIEHASESVRCPEASSNLAHQNVQNEPDKESTTASQVKERQNTDKVNKAACSKKRIIGSVVLTLVLALILGRNAFGTNFGKNVANVRSNQREDTTATGLFAATSTGLIYLNLRTLEATVLTSESTCAVAVNHKLKKVYWATYSSRSSILRSNFNGSAKKIIVPPTDDWIFALAIDEVSGKLYYAPYSSNKLIVCNALGTNCIGHISEMLYYPLSIVLDAKNNFIYWGNHRHGSSAHSVVRFNMDRKTTFIISNGFRDLYGITLGEAGSSVLYWVDREQNTIGTFDVSSGKKSTLVALNDYPGPWGIQVDAHKIYIGNYVGRNIQSVDRDSGKELTTIFNSTGNVYSLALFNAPVKQNEGNK